MPFVLSLKESFRQVFQMRILLNGHNAIHREGSNVKGAYNIVADTHSRSDMVSVSWQKHRNVNSQITVRQWPKLTMTQVETCLR
ncbi:unnamed protein product [Protopolystoma xenopodis]|uniref:Uncharacterized protein n=1 Tax=Protopolystoma xenopodis TaxID=117903 RepID=A0A448WGC7_9PLAT|nr:unnamed protein product [Protopolystoma xenopodis]